MCFFNTAGYFEVGAGDVPQDYLLLVGYNSEKSYAENACLDRYFLTDQKNSE
jgi:hypothetical protein